MGITRLGLIKASLLAALCVCGLAAAQPAHAWHSNHHSYGVVYSGPGFGIGYYGGHHRSGYSVSYYADPYYYGGYGYDPYYSYVSAPYYPSFYYSSGYYGGYSHHRDHRDYDRYQYHYRDDRGHRGDRDGDRDDHHHRDYDHRSYYPHH